ncbi:MAG: hypothetical protein RII27_09515, partial [Alphaproteobacteria bacterium]
MIDHIGMAVTDLERAKGFYSAALQPLGISLIARFGAVNATCTGSPCGAGPPIQKKGLPAAPKPAAAPA